MKYLLLAAALLGVFGSDQKASSGKGEVKMTNDGSQYPPPPK
jgi:hypothetical protein